MSARLSPTIDQRREFSRCLRLFLAQEIIHSNQSRFSPHIRAWIGNSRQNSFFKTFPAKSRQNPGKIPAWSALIMNRLIVLCFAALIAATSSQECGKRFHNQQLDELQQWIVGGVTAMKGGYPYQVKIVVKIGSQFRYATKSFSSQNCRGDGLSQESLLCRDDIASPS